MSNGVESVIDKLTKIYLLKSPRRALKIYKFMPYFESFCESADKSMAYPLI